MAAEFGKTRKDILTQKCVNTRPLLIQFLVTYSNVHLISGLDAGIKWRPQPPEVAEVGPEFQEYWDSFFANAPDKPVLWFGVVSGFVP